MTALDFMMACIGTGVLLVCAAHAFKVLSVTRSTTKVARELTHRREEPLDPMNQRLQEFRQAQFGRPMTPPTRQPPQTWPVMGVRPAAPPPPDDKRTKVSDKKQGGK